MRAIILVFVKRPAPRTPVAGDLSTSEALERFRKAAKPFTARATESQESARQVLVSEDIYTKPGKLTKQYS